MYVCVCVLMNRLVLYGPGLSRPLNIYTLSDQFISYTHLVLGSDPALPPEQSEFSGTWKHCLIGFKGPNVCQENIPHTITPPAYTIDTQAGWGHGLILLTPLA
jgi:hypothetical protein